MIYFMVLVFFILEKYTSILIFTDKYFYTFIFISLYKITLSYLPFFSYFLKQWWVQITCMIHCSKLISPTNIFLTIKFFSVIFLYLLNLSAWLCWSFPPTDSHGVIARALTHHQKDLGTRECPCKQESAGEEAHTETITFTC